MTTISLATTTSTIDAFRAFVTFEVRRAARNRRYVMFAIALPTVFYLLYTGVLSGAAADPSAAIDGLPWRTYFMVSTATYGAIVAALGGAVVIADERASGWTRQLRATPLSAATYVVGKLAVSLIVTVPAIIGVLVAAAAVDGVRLSPTSWLLLLLVLVVGSLPFAALGLLIGYVFGRDGAQGAVMVAFFSLAILGGLWAPISSFPDGLATIGRMLPSYYLAGIGRDVAGGSVPSGLSVVALAAYGALIGAVAAWRYRTVESRGA